MLLLTTGRAPEERRRPLLIPKVVRSSIVLLIAATLLTFVSAICSHLWKSWCMVKVNWFISPWYKVPMERQWYLFFGGEKLFNLIICYVSGKIALMFSDALFLSLVVVLGYIIIDNIMFWWNFNDDFYLYFDFLWTMLIFLHRCINPYRVKTIAKIKSLF
jgi:hypothetical protein